MKQEQPQQIKTISAVIIVIILIFGVGYVLWGKYNAPEEVNQQVSDDNNSQKAMIVTVENTPMVNGALPVPAGFPQSIPLESGSLVESATTQYPAESVQQLSASYRSSKTVTEKYSEYKNYMERAGYQITENTVNSPTKAIFGTKENTNLSVAISNSEGKTLVQLSYLLK